LGETDLTRTRAVLMIGPTRFAGIGDVRFPGRY